MSEKEQESSGSEKNIVVRAGAEGWRYWDEVCTDPKKAAGHAVTLLQLIPVVGGVIKDNITEYVTNKKEARIEEMFAAVRKRIGCLEEHLKRDYVNSDEYTHLMVHAILRAQYEHRQLKLKMLGFTLAELATDRWPYEFDVQERLVDIVADMGEDHAEILELLAAQNVQPLITGSHHPLSLLDLFNNAKLIQHLEPRRREIVLRAAMDWLEARGLVVRSHNKDGTNVTEDLPPAMRHTFMSNEFCSVTHLGLDLAKMIQSQPA